MSIRICNIRYREDPEKNCRMLYDKIVTKAQAEIQFLRMELQIKIKKVGKKHIETALARYNLGRAHLETTQAVEEFEAAIFFMSQREPSHHHRRVTEKARDMALETISLF